jgi:hypothetical protein
MDLFDVSCIRNPSAISQIVLTILMSALFAACAAAATNVPADASSNSDAPGSRDGFVVRPGLPWS